MRDLRAAFVSQGVSSGGQFIVSLVLVRYLGLAGFGVLGVAFLVAAYAAGLAQALIAQPFLASGCGRSRATCAVLFAFALAAVAGTVCGAAAMLLQGSFALSPWAVGALVFGRVLTPVVRSATFAMGRPRATLAIDTACGLGALALVFPLAITGRLTIHMALVAVAAASIAAGAIGSLFVPYARIDVSVARSTALRFWGTGKWLALNQVASWFGTGSFQVAAAVYLGPAGLGAIRAAQTVVGVLGTAVQALELALPQRAFRALHSPGGRAALRRWTFVWSSRLAVAFALAGAGLALLAPVISGHLVVGAAAREEASLAIALLGFLPAIAAWTTVHHIEFRTLETTRPVFLAYVASAAVAACIASPTVAAFGVAGAALGLVATQGLFAILLSGLARVPRARVGALCAAP